MATYTGLFAIYAVYVIYIGLNAYSEKDPDHCFYIDGVETPGTTSQNVRQSAEELGIAVKAGYPIDMAHIFHVWFLWGFWDKIFQLSFIAPALTIWACSATKQFNLPVKILFW